MKNIVLIGAPGSGKGTQSALLFREIGICRIATGDIFRKHLEQETQLGILAKKYIVEGELVPDYVTIEMVKAWLSKNIKTSLNGLLFDGFPRNVKQAIALDKMMAKMNDSIDGVLSLELRDGWERNEEVQATAAILSAQLSTLLVPDATVKNESAEAAQA